MPNITNELQIWFGHPAFPGQSYPVYGQPDSIDLVNFNGFSVSLDGWIPKIAPIKGGGVYLENPVSEGKELVAASRDLVEETLTLVSGTATLTSRWYAESRLILFGERALQYHIQAEQASPVYLKWHALGAPAPQFALIYRIELAKSDNALTPDQVGTLSLVIQREPYWSAIPPRMNPKYYTFQKAGTTPTLSQLDLYSGANDLQLTTIKNKHEWGTITVVGEQSTRLSTNIITIPAALIPGDAPARCIITLQDLKALDASDNPTGSSGNIIELLIGKSTRPIEGYNREGNLRKRSFNINMGDGQAVVGTKTINAGSAFSANSIANKYSWNYTVPSSAPYGTSVWHLATNEEGAQTTAPTAAGAAGSAGQMVRFDAQLGRGKYAVFMRYTISAAGVYAQLRATDSSVSSAERRIIGTNILTVPGQPDFDPSLVYLGVVNVPSFGKDIPSASGLGGALDEVPFMFELYFRNTVAATRSFVGYDLFFLPIDEGSAHLQVAGNTFNVAVSVPGIAIDNTGYLDANRYPKALGGFSSPEWGSYDFSWFRGTPIWYKGQEIFLTPGVDNHLVFLARAEVGGTRNWGMSKQLTFAINIVPRWAGVRSSL